MTKSTGVGRGMKGLYRECPQDREKSDRHFEVWEAQDRRGAEKACKLHLADLVRVYRPAEANRCT